MGAVSAAENEKVLGTGGGDGCTTMRMCLMPLNCTSKNSRFCYVRFTTRTHTNVAFILPQRQSLPTSLFFVRKADKGRLG